MGMCNIYMDIPSFFSLHSQGVTEMSCGNSLNNLRNKIRLISAISDEFVAHRQVMPETQAIQRGKKTQGAALSETFHLCHSGGQHIN